MVVVVVAFAETDKGDQPAVPAAVLCAVRLVAPHMTQGVDGERRIQDQYCSQHAREQKTSHSAHETIVDIPGNKGCQQSGGDDRRVVTVLPHDDRVLAEPSLIGV